MRTAGIISSLMWLPIAAFLLTTIPLVGLSRAQSASTGAQWSASTFCTYAILLESHVIATRCGMPLDSASEQRYRKILAAVR